jgi:hypothetical protein
MKKYTFSKTLAAGLLACSLVGCAGTKINIESYVPPNIDRTRGKTVEGSGSGLQLFWLIPCAINGRHARAYEELKRNAGDAYITDVKISEAWWYAFVGTIYATKLEATAYPKTAVLGPVNK